MDNEEIEFQIWNKRREKLEDIIITYSKELIKHAGCNHIQLPFVLDKNMEIIIKPTGMENLS